jgi:hypothetical protein
MFVSELREVAEIIRLLANIAYWTAVGCMTAQVRESLTPPVPYSLTAVGVY